MDVNWFTLWVKLIELDKFPDLWVTEVVPDVGACEKLGDVSVELGLKLFVLDLELK